MSNAQVDLHYHAGGCHGNNGPLGAFATVLWHGVPNAPLPFVDHGWSSEYSCSTHMLEELACRPIKRLAAGVASWLEKRMREPTLQRIIQLRKHQQAKLTKKKRPIILQNMRHLLKLNKVISSVETLLKSILYISIFQLCEVKQDKIQVENKKRKYSY